MTGFTLIWRNLLRNKVRTALMLFSIAVAFTTYGVLGSFLSSFSVKEQAGSADRLMVTSRVNFMQTIPISYVDRVRGIEGVRSATPVRWSVAHYREPKDILPIIFVDAASYFPMVPEVEVSPRERQAFDRTRNGVLVGRDLAAERGWAVGDRVTLTTARDIRTDGTAHWDFVVSGIYRAASPAADQRGALAHYTYLNEGIAGGRDGINWIMVRTGNPDANEAVSRRIDSLFGNSSAQTKTQSEIAFARAFLSQLGDIATIVSLIVGASFVIILMIVGNTMVFTINERTREIGLLKTLGFSSARIVGLIAGEVLLLAFLGGLTGLAVAMLMLAPLGIAMQSLVPDLQLDASVVMGGVGLMFLVGLLAGIVPTFKAHALQPIDALNRRLT